MGTSSIALIMCLIGRGQLNIGEGHAFFGAIEMLIILFMDVLFISGTCVVRSCIDHVLTGIYLHDELISNQYCSINRLEITD